MFMGTQSLNFPQSQDTQALSYEQIISKIANVIEQNDPRNGNLFFKEFDAYFDRKYQVWEIAAMFEISLKEARSIA
jgi:hypothetical protein